MNKKKVLIVHHRDVYSGAEKVMIDTLSCWKENVSFTHLVPLDSRLSEILETNNQNTIYSKYLDGYSDTSFQKYLSNYVHFTRELIELNKSYDIILGNTIYAGIRCWLFSIIIRKRSRRISLIIHDIFDTRFSRNMLRLLILPYDKVIAVSNATKNLNGLSSSNKVQVIYNGIEVLDNEVPSYLNRDIVVIVGLLDPWKGQSNLLRQSVDLKAPQFMFVGGGRNTIYQKELESISNGKDSFVGELRDPWKFIRSQGINFSINSSIRPDPLPTVVLESIANGVVPFVTNLGGAREMIPEELWPKLVINFAERNSIDSMFRYIESISVEEYTRIIEKLHEHVLKEFSLDSKREKFLNFLE